MAEQLLRVGQVFAGRYRIERALASGGFGAVYVAEQVATENRVAVKILWPHILDSETAVAGFQQEARISARVNSEHIVRVLDAGFDQETRAPYLVMELLDGLDLGRIVRQSGPLPAGTVLVLMRQVASALDKAHSYVDRDGKPRPIVHRDLKPENLFLTRRENGEPLLKLLDFGIAKVASASMDLSREIKGTPLYMAYEQASGDPVTPRTDVWALGLIVFFLLTGRSYWKSASGSTTSMKQIFAEVLTLPIVPPSSRIAELGVVAALPAGFDEWFLRCVRRDPEQRFAGAVAAVEALDAVLGEGGASRERGAGPTAFELANTVAAPAPAAAAVDPAAATEQAADARVALRSHSVPAGAQTAEPLAISHAAASPPASRRVLLAVAALLVGAAIMAYLVGRSSRPRPAPAAREAVASAAPSASPGTVPAAAASIEGVASPAAAASVERGAASAAMRASATPHPAAVDGAAPPAAVPVRRAPQRAARAAASAHPLASGTTPSSAPTASSNRRSIYGER